MEYNLDKLNAMITSDDLFTLAIGVMKEYQSSIDMLMSDNIESDVNELKSRMNPSDVDDLEQFATDETTKRISKYKKIFFDKKMERLLDEYSPIFRHSFGSFICRKLFKIVHV